MAENCEDVQRFLQQQNGDPRQDEFQQQFVFPAEQLPSFPAMMMQLMASLQQIVQQVQEQNVELLRMFSLGGVHVPTEAETYTARSTHYGDLSYEDRANNLQVESQRLLGLQCAYEQIQSRSPQIQAIIPLGPECSGERSFSMKRGKEEGQVDESIVANQRSMPEDEYRNSRRSQDAGFNDTIIIDQPWWQSRFPGSRSPSAAIGGPSSPVDETISDRHVIKCYNLLNIVDKSSHHFSRDCTKSGRLPLAIRMIVERAHNQRCARSIYQRFIQPPSQGQRGQQYNFHQFFTTVAKVRLKELSTTRPRMRPRTRWKVGDSTKCEPSQTWCHAAVVVISSE